ncbi:MAG: hypothetical protein AAGA68_18365 [Pseudomonadota bacterium]
MSRPQSFGMSITLTRSVRLALVGMSCHAAGGDQLQIDLGSLPPSTGTRLLGSAIEEDFFGYSVAPVGDVNGDGIDDLAIGAIGFDQGDQRTAGRAYVLFGRSELDALEEIRLDALESSEGFIFEGVKTSDFVGGSLSAAGDLNGDGFTEVAIGAFFADSEIGADNDTGQVYVVFGSDGPFPEAPLTRSDLDGTIGFILRGQFPGGIAGQVAVANDVNGDGYDDLIVGATDAYPADIPSAGQGYIVFGGPSIGQSGSVELIALRGDTGAVVNGADPFEDIGRAVAGAGDLNGDGFADVVFGAIGASPEGISLAGQVHFIFGSSSPYPQRVSVSELNGANGFTFECEQQSGRCGLSVSGVGDVNADGLDDAAFSGPRVNRDEDLDVGETYVVFGSAVVGGNGLRRVSEIDGSNGVRVIGAAAGDQSGVQVSSPGDWNGDGTADLLIGAPGASLLGRDTAGAVYLLFGKSDFGSNGEIALGHWDPSDGVVFVGADPGDSAGFATAGGGDFNGDGADDLLIGAYNASLEGEPRAGAAYILWGQAGADADGDSVSDGLDNCSETPNADQRDSNANGFGNACDADLNDDCSVDIRDWLVMRGVLGTGNADADLDGDGIVNVTDARLLLERRLQPPGPSGLTENCRGE